MFIDVSMVIRPGSFFRRGVSPVEIGKKKFLEGTREEFEATVIAMPAHTSTHIDLVFPERMIAPEMMVGRGVLIDVHGISGDMIRMADFEEKIEIGQSDYVFFRTDWDRFAGTERYFEHPQLSREILDWLIEKKIYAVGIDTQGLARDPLHGEYDRLMAENDINVIENLSNLKAINGEESFKVYCFPLKIEGIDAIPARVVVEQ